jgi:hypothetical protein
MPLALSTQMPRPAARSTRAVLTRLDGTATPPTPAWARAQLGTDTLVADGLKLSSLLAALPAVQPDVDDDRSGAVDWVADDDNPMAIELLFPLLQLARDIRQLGDEDMSGEFVLDGA